MLLFPNSRERPFQGTKIEYGAGAISVVCFAEGIVIGAGSGAQLAIHNQEGRPLQIYKG